MMSRQVSGFPNNRRHQGLATLIARQIIMPSALFPINRRHQGLATLLGLALHGQVGSRGFQSIGVTKDWRRCRYPGSGTQGSRASGFQSIGVTKDWRHAASSVVFTLSGASFQSIGVTKDWRHPVRVARRAVRHRVSNQ